MAAPSGSVENLEDFIAELTKAHTKVEAGIEVLGNRADGLDQLEDKVGDELGALSDQIEAFQKEVESGTESAEQDVKSVEEKAHEIAEARFGAAKEDLEQAVDDLEDRLKTGSDDLDNDATALNETGFRAMGETLDDIQATLESAGQENDRAFDGFGNAAEKLGGEAEQRFDATVNELGEAMADLVTQAATLAAAAQSGGEELADALTELEGQCDTIQGELDQVYDDVEAKIDSEGDDLINSVRGLFDDTSQFVTVSREESLEPATDAVLTEAAPAASSALDELEPLLESAAPTAGETAALAPDLNTAWRVVDTVKQMLDAMGG